MTDKKKIAERIKYVKSIIKSETEQFEETTDEITDDELRTDILKYFWSVRDCYEEILRYYEGKEGVK